MYPDQKKFHDNNVGREEIAFPPLDVIRNENPKANENIRERTDESED